MPVTPLEAQRRDYSEAMQAWPEGMTFKYPVSGQDLGFALAVLKGTSTDIANAKDMAELQQCIVILNVNEFRLTDVPTSEEFYALVDDFIRWNKRVEKYIQGTKEELAQLWTLLDAVAQQAREKYAELSA